MNDIKQNDIALSEPLRSNRRVYGTAGVAVAGVLVAASVAAFHIHHAVPASRAASPAARRSAPTCHGPIGAAYVAEAGYSAFGAIETSNCSVVQTYNVDDPGVPGDPDDTNYSSTPEGIAVHGTTLYFADTGTSRVAVINAKTLDPSNYSPPEKVINVGSMPEDLALTPNGKQLWVADTGPQTGAGSPSGVTVVDTATGKISARWGLGGAPTQIAVNPSGTRAYVATTEGLWVYDVQTDQRVATIGGLGHAHGIAVSPNGATVYVTDTSQGTVATIDAATDHVVAWTKVGQMPWQVVVSANGATVYVADADSDAVSVINAKTGKVSKTITVGGDPDTLALTPNGKELWVGGDASGVMSVLDTATGSTVGTIQLGGYGPQSGDGLEPVGMVLVRTPTPTS